MKHRYEHLTFEEIKNHPGARAWEITNTDMGGLRGFIKMQGGEIPVLQPAFHAEFDHIYTINALKEIIRFMAKVKKEI